MNISHYAIFCIYTVACLATNLFFVRRVAKLEAENARLKKENYDLRHCITRAIDPRRADAWRLEKNETTTKGTDNE